MSELADHLREVHGVDVLPCEEDKPGLLAVMHRAAQLHDAVPQPRREA